MVRNPLRAGLEPRDGGNLRVAPLFPLPNVFLFPGCVMPLHVFEPRYRQMVEDLLDGPGQVVMGTLEQDHAGARSVIVDPYHDGRTRTEAECRSYLAKHGAASNAAAFRDAPDASLLRRQVANLARSAQLRGRVREARLLVTAVRALEPGRPPGSLPG